jgi:alpha-L-fucosidase
MSEFLKNYSIESGPFEASWESLRTYQCPDWFRDAKLGIWAHWGPQCVPLAGDWYARHLYLPETADGQKHAQAVHHRKTYGHPSQFGFKDIIPQWKAEKFNPDELMALYKKAGAKYFVSMGVHHDNFDLWNSAHQPRWNAVATGPQRDILGDWQRAAQAQGLKFGVSEHLGASFSWWRGNKGSDKVGPYTGVPYDGNDPAFEDLYYPNHNEPENAPWLTENVWFHEHWFKRIKDLVDKYQPDLLYSDSALPWDKVGLSIVAHLYNRSAAQNNGSVQAVYTQKDTQPEVHGIGVLDIERGQMNDATPFVWQTDTCVAGWFYDSRQPYKTPSHVIEMFVDIVSKNGCLLLNFTQRPDGTLDEPCLHILQAMSDWIAVNGEGIYGTRPWRVAGEGPAQIESGAFKEKALSWTTADFRFTSKGNSVYAFQMHYPERREAFIRSLGTSSGANVKAVSLLGHDAPIFHRQHEDGLLVQLPEQKVCDYVPCFKVELS